MVTNFAPLATDSCYFTDTVQVNLHPTATSVKEIPAENPVFGIYPNPAGEFVRVITNITHPTVFLCNLNGNIINTFVNPSGIDLRQLDKGVYLLKCRETGRVQKLVKD